LLPNSFLDNFVLCVVGVLRYFVTPLGLILLLSNLKGFDIYAWIDSALFLLLSLDDAVGKRD